jgi:hypothetical protein
LLGSWFSVWAGTRRNLSEELGKKRVQLGDLNLVVVPANLHIN